MNQFLHLLGTLETHLDQIRTDLGTDWPEFAAQVQSLAPAFEAAQDETELARAVGDLYMACQAREPVMAILRQTADTSRVGHDRRPPAGGTGYEDTMPVREIVNRFQSLFDRLKEIERLEEGKDQRGENTSQSGAENADDRRTHP
jgi:hypothetical protein